MERTLLIIKPDAVGAGNTGNILAMLERGGFQVAALRMEHLAEESARRFYEVHRERPFYGELVEFMTSGPCVPMVLEKENAIADLRTFIGATNPAEAEEGTVRKLYATSVQNNAVHALDVWRGKRRSDILNSFSRGTPAKLCQGCTAYRPSTFLGSGIFKNIHKDRRLPLEFYVKFLGG